ncbi:LysR substrate-binding domain-containing protein [Cupriavidus basilensis]
MTLKQLEASLLGARTCSSFTPLRPSELHLPRHRCSKRIAELEDSLGQALFDRSGHKAALTDAGNRLVPRAACAAARGRRTAHRDRHRGGPAWQMPLRRGRTHRADLAASAGADDHRGTSRPGTGNPCQHWRGAGERVEDGELDFAVVAGKSTRGTVASHAIAQAKFVWCMSAQATGRSAPISPETPGDRPLVTLLTGSGVTRLLDEWMDGRGSLPERRIVCNHWGAVAGMLVEGIVSASCPQSWAQSLAKRGRVARPAQPIRRCLPCLLFSMAARRLAAAGRRHAGTDAAGGRFPSRRAGYCEARLPWS